MEPISEPRRVGLARALSKLGYWSRAHAAKLIQAGRVRLNGTTRRDPEAPVRLERDRIAVDGNSVTAESKIYVMLNKPRGVVTTASDENGRKTVYSLLGKDLPWVGPVGRLDKASEGLLLLTNDSEWAARLCEPSSHLSKTYHVHLGATITDELINDLIIGIRAGGELLRATRAHKLRGGDKNTWLEMTLEEGKNRQIRRMCEARGIEVLRLIRVAIGPLLLGQLSKGKFRPLAVAEKGALDQALKMSRERAAIAEKR
jgi:23S rRNA pseudouridine2605 synthase